MNRTLDALEHGIVGPGEGQGDSPSTAALLDPDQTRDLQDLVLPGAEVSRPLSELRDVVGQAVIIVDLGTVPRPGTRKPLPAGNCGMKPLPDGTATPEGEPARLTGR